MDPLPHISTGDTIILIAFFLAVLIATLTVVALTAVGLFRVFQRSRARRAQADPHLRELWAGTRTLHPEARPRR